MLTTTSLCFMMYVVPAIAVSVMQHFDMSFAYFADVAVVGSLVGALVASLTLGTGTWQDQLRYAGVTGMLVGLVALVGPRDLAPRIRKSSDRHDA